MIQYIYLGRVEYDEGLRLQAEIAALRVEGRVDNVLLLLEHPPVLTLGRNARRANVLASDEMLARRGVTLHEINRGGDVTYHGPGQLVGYPIFDLRSLQNASGGRLGPVDFVRDDGRGADPAVRRVWRACGADCGADGRLVRPCGRQPFGREFWQYKRSKDRRDWNSCFARDYFAWVCVQRDDGPAGFSTDQSLRHYGQAGDEPGAGDRRKESASGP